LVYETFSALTLDYENYNFDAAVMQILEFNFLNFVFKKKI